MFHTSPFLLFPVTTVQDKIPKNSILARNFSLSQGNKDKSCPAQEIRETRTRFQSWSLVVIGRLIRLIRLDLQWRGRLHSYMWMDGMGLDGWLSWVVGSLRAPSVLIKNWYTLHRLKHCIVEKSEHRPPLWPVGAMCSRHFVIRDAFQ